MLILTAEIKEILKLLLEETELHLGDSIEIEDDYYWEVINDEIFNIDKDFVIDESAIGQLSEDWIELKRLLKSGELSASGSIPISYDFNRIIILFLALRKKSIGTW